MNVAIALLCGLVLLGAVQGFAIQRRMRFRRETDLTRSGKPNPHSALVCYYFKRGLSRKFETVRCQVGEVCLDFWDGVGHTHSCATTERCRQLEKFKLPWVRCCDEDLCNG